MPKYNIAIVGIRGAVGGEMLRILKERKFPYNQLKLISTSLHGDQIDEKGNTIEKIHDRSFKDIQIGLFSQGDSISEIWVPIAVKSGCVVIDNTSKFRMAPDVPLVVPEVNPEEIRNHKGIIANPNCSTIQMVIALKPLHDYAKIKRIVISTYQSVSGAGVKGITELCQQSINVALKPDKFPHQVAFNIIPHIDVPQDNLYTKEEMKMVNETRKILKGDSIGVTATCVRVPVIRSHCESINIETEKKVSRGKALELLSHAPGVTVVDNIFKSQYPLPLNAEGKDDIFVGRIREDESIKNGLNLWVVSDNLRKGAALNAVQIAEELIKRGMT